MLVWHIEPAHLTNCSNSWVWCYQPESGKMNDWAMREVSEIIWSTRIWCRLNSFTNICSTYMNLMPQLFICKKKPKAYLLLREREKAGVEPISKVFYIFNPGVNIFNKYVNISTKVSICFNSGENIMQLTWTNIHLRIQHVATAWQFFSKGPCWAWEAVGTPALRWWA